MGKFFTEIYGRTIYWLAGAASVVLTIIGILSEHGFRSADWFYVAAYASLILAAFGVYSRQRNELAKLTPQIEILDKVEDSDAGCVFYICVHNSSGLAIRFGAEIRQIEPRDHGIQMPFGIRHRDSPDDRFEVLPAGGRRLLRLLGAAQGAVYFYSYGNQSKPCLYRNYTITICAYCENGASVEKRFRLDITGGKTKLIADVG